MSDADAVNLGLLFLRGGVGVVMLAHGINHIFRGGKIAGTGRWFAKLGMKPGIVHAWLASLTELGAGAMLVAGLLTPVAAAGVVGTMAVAFVTNHRTNGFFIFRPGEGYEYVLTLMLCGLALGPLGGGQWSLDNALDLTDLYGATGLYLAAGLGFGGALVLLAGFWRRPAPEE
jgi:putative oxidoreductase